MLGLITNCVVSWILQKLTDALVALCCHANPNLQDYQTCILRGIIQECSRELNGGDYQRCLSFLRNILSLISQDNPDPDIREILGLIMELLPPGSWTEPKCILGTFSQKAPALDAELRDKLGITHPAVFWLDLLRRRHLLLTINRRLKEDKNIRCPISFDELFSPATHKIQADVIALFEGGGENIHVHFFRGKSLICWFSKSAPINPVTRSYVGARDFCRLSFEQNLEHESIPRIDKKTFSHILEANNVGKDFANNGGPGVTHSDETDQLIGMRHQNQFEPTARIERKSRNDEPKCEKQERKWEKNERKTEKKGRKFEQNGRKDEETEGDDMDSIDNKYKPINTTNVSVYSKIYRKNGEKYQAEKHKQEKHKESKTKILKSVTDKYGRQKENSSEKESIESSKLGEMNPNAGVSTLSEKFVNSSGCVQYKHVEAVHTLNPYNGLPTSQAPYVHTSHMVESNHASRHTEDELKSVANNRTNLLSHKNRNMSNNQENSLNPDNPSITNVEEDHQAISDHSNKNKQQIISRNKSPLSSVSLATKIFTQSLPLFKILNLEI